MLQRLSAFTGGWTVDAAEAVCVGREIREDGILDLLSQLTSKSLVLARRRSGEEARYNMLETIREYARVKLVEAGEEVAVCDRHLDYFVRLAEIAEPQLSRPNQVSWLNRLDTDHENLRAAAVWALERKAAAPALHLVGALSVFWYTRGHYYEARELSTQILSSPFSRERTAARMKALHIAGFIQWTLESKSDVSPMLQEALEIAIEIGDSSNIAWTRIFLGIVTSTHGDHQDGLSHMEQGLEQYEALDSARIYDVGFALAFLGDGYFFHGNYQHAQEIYQRAVDVLSEVQDKNVLAYALRRLSHIARYQGDLEEAEQKCRQSFEINMKLEHHQAVAACITGFACIALDRGEAQNAVQLFAAAENQLEMTGVWLMPADSIEFDKNVTLAREQLGEEPFAAAWAEGRAMTIEHAIELAMKSTALQV